METKKQYLEKKSALKQMLVGEPQTVTPIQEVRPVATKSKSEDLVRINGFDVPSDLARRMKIYGVDTGMKQRQILVAALEAYLPK